MFHVECCKSRSDVAYVGMVVHVGCKLLFSMFQLFFADIYCKCVYLNVACASHICCMYVYLDVAYILEWLFRALSGVSTSVSDVCCKCFIWMFQK
jgi:hypothetical protein